MNIDLTPGERGSLEVILGYYKLRVESFDVIDSILAKLEAARAAEKPAEKKPAFDKEFADRAFEAACRAGGHGEESK